MTRTQGRGSTCRGHFGSRGGCSGGRICYRSRSPSFLRRIQSDPPPWALRAHNCNRSSSAGCHGHKERGERLLPCSAPSSNSSFLSAPLEGEKPTAPPTRRFVMPLTRWLLMKLDMLVGAADGAPSLAVGCNGTTGGPLLAMVTAPRPVSAHATAGHTIATAIAQSRRVTVWFAATQPGRGEDRVFTSEKSNPPPDETRFWQIVIYTRIQSQLA